MKAKAEAINLTSTFCFAIAIVVCSFSKSHSDTNLTPEEAQQVEDHNAQELRNQQKKACYDQCDAEYERVLILCRKLSTGLDGRADATDIKRCSDPAGASATDCIHRCTSAYR
jgi:hypothetical protein